MTTYEDVKEKGGCILLYAVWPDFELVSGLHYVNAMESAISCMETELISANNIAITLSRRLPRSANMCGESGQPCDTK
eukprot:3849827-Pyramimonas_sp.AAC.3